MYRLQMKEIFQTEGRAQALAGAPENSMECSGNYSDSLSQELKGHKEDCQEIRQNYKSKE